MILWCYEHWRRVLTAVASLRRCWARTSWMGTCRNMALSWTRSWRSWWGATRASPGPNSLTAITSTWSPQKPLTSWTSCSDMTIRSGTRHALRSSAQPSAERPSFVSTCAASAKALALLLLAPSLSCLRAIAGCLLASEVVCCDCAGKNDSQGGDGPPILQPSPAAGGPIGLG